MSARGIANTRSALRLCPRGLVLAASLVGGVLLGSAGGAEAAPKVCGNDANLGNFAIAACPELKDDGVAPDQAAGDGVYTVQVSISAKPMLEYKILPTGDYSAQDLRQLGDCGPGGKGSNAFGNIQVPGPDVTQPVRFFYDSRALTDPSYASPPGNRSGGDELTMKTAGGGRCPQWQAVGEFQNVPFDRVVGTVSLSITQPGVLTGRLLVMKNLAPGWKWKVVDAGGLPARQFGPSGWAWDGCDDGNTNSVTVAAAAKPGDLVFFTFYPWNGRLQTVVSNTEADLGAPGGLMQCPAAPDLGDPPTDLASGPDLATLGSTDAGGGTDASSLGDGGAGRPLPGIHCNCQVGARSVSGSATPGPLALIAALVGLPLLLLQRHRRRRSVCRT